TISIEGQLIFDATARTAITVSPEGGGNVDVQSTAELGGQLTVTLSGGPFVPGAQYVLLRAQNGLENTFSSVNIDYQPDPSFTPQVTYDATHVYLYLAPSGSPTPTPTPTPSATPTASPRARPTPRVRPTPRSRPTPARFQ